MKQRTTLLFKFAICMLLLLGSYRKSSAQTGSVLSLDGIDDYLLIQNSSAYEFGTGDFTVEAWIKTTSNATGVVIGSGGSGDFWLGISSGKAGFSISGTPLIGATTINDDQWHHIAGARRSGVLYLYVDGVEDGTLSNGLYFSPAGQPVTIGNFNGGFNYSGLVDDIRVWNAGESAANIAARRNTELVGNEPGLLSYFKFNQGVAGGDNTNLTTADDNAGGYFAAIVNLTLNGPSSNFILGSPIVPETASYLNFDGTNDRITCPVVVPSTDCTIEFWFRTTNPNAGLFTVSSSSGHDRDIYLTSGNVRLYMYTPTMQYITTSGVNYADGNWHRVSVVINSTTGTFIYVDRVQRVRNSGIRASAFNWNDRIYIGYSQLSNTYGNADIDEVRVWNVPRSAGQIADRCQLAGNETGLLAYYRFDQGRPGAANSAVTSLVDATVNGNNGTLENFSLVGTTSNWLSGSELLNGPFVTSTINYCQNAPSTQLTASGNSLLWYTSQFGGTGSSTAPTPSTSAIGTTSYWVTAGIALCGESPRSRIDVVVSPLTLATVNTTQAIDITSSTTFATNCANLITSITPSGANPVSGSTTSKVWIEATQHPQYVKRHYEITPATGASTATATITLYFTQAEFDAFNAVNSIKLPAGPSDASGKANLLIEKRSGTSNNGTGLPTSYTGTTININPNDANIVWNATSSRWEITFDVAGFSGFFLKTLSGVLPVKLISFTANTTTTNEVSLQWKTSDEKNVAQFEIEVGSNGINFQKTGITVAGKNNGLINTYQVKDVSNWTTDVKYYRLKMIDIDGKATYSAIIKISNKVTNKVSIYPNPFQLGLTITSTKTQNAQITDVTGRIIQNLKLTAGSNYLNTGSWNSGIYFLKTADGQITKLNKD